MRTNARDMWRRMVACLLALAMVVGMAPAAPVREALAAEGAGIEEVSSEGGDAAIEDVVEEEPIAVEGEDGAQSPDETRGGGAAPSGEGRAAVVVDEDALLEELREIAEADLAAGQGDAEEAPEGKAAEDEAVSGDIVLGAQAVSVSDPRVVADSSMRAGQVTTWDCVWLGSYPQTEVTSSDAEYASLEAASWDSKGDATVGGQRYRRISRDDTTPDYTTICDLWSDDGYDSATYRYFRWEPIKWRVLEANGSNALVVADVAL